jgi:hypothetical protein
MTHQTSRQKPYNSLWEAAKDEIPELILNVLFWITVIMVIGIFKVLISQ